MIFLDFLIFNVIIIAGSITLFGLLGYKLIDYSLIVSLLIGLPIYILFPDTIDFAIIVLSTLSINALYSKNAFLFIFILIFISILNGAFQPRLSFFFLFPSHYPDSSTLRCWKATKR